MWQKRLIPRVLLIVLCLPAGLSAAQGWPDFARLIGPDEVMGHIHALSVDIGARPAGSEAEADAAAYIAAAFEAWGYAVTFQTFDMTEALEEEDVDADSAFSSNVIAVREGDDSIVVVGAHLDSVTDGTGAGDNASGVAAMLAAAEALADVNIPHTLVFVAFGAEELGFVGSYAYVDALGPRADDVIAMINLDTVGMGPTLNAYAGAEIRWPKGDDDPILEEGPVWVRDLAFDLAAEMNLPLGTSPAESYDGFIDDCSDHYPFVEAGIPVVYFDAWLWEGAEDPWWGQETAEGDILHTADDVYENIVPERVETAAELAAATAYALASGLATPE